MHGVNVQLPIHGKPFGFLWVFLSIIGYIAAGFLSHFPSGTNGESQWMPDAAVVGLFQGTIGGVQWFVLKLAGFNFGGRWMLAAVVAFAITHAVGDARPVSVGFSVLGLFSGALAGLLYWFAQRRKGSPILWIRAP